MSDETVKQDEPKPKGAKKPKPPAFVKKEEPKPAPHVAQMTRSLKTGELIEGSEESRED